MGEPRDITHYSIIEVEWEGSTDAGEKAVESICDALMETLLDSDAITDPAVSATLSAAGWSLIRTDPDTVESAIIAGAEALVVLAESIRPGSRHCNFDIVNGRDGYHLAEQVTDAVLRVLRGDPEVTL